MCTVSVVPTASGFRLMCNRDEQTTRPAALPPRTQRVGSVTATFPTDPQSGGTWIAVTDAGLALALLNRRFSGVDDPDLRSVRSRGGIIPQLIGARSLADVRRKLKRLRPQSYQGFQLVAIHRRQRLVGTSDGSTLELSMAGIDSPVMFTSSSLGDRDAERVRRPIFESLVCRGRDALDGQRQFHDHRWPDCPSFSVRMKRADAYTVSRSIAEVREGRALLDYQPLPAE
jgi:uncharacterized protein with NRDE domain